MRFIINKNAVSSIDEGELVILHMSNGKFYGLDAVGTDVWECIQSGKSLDEIIYKLHQEYGVTIEKLQHDINNFINNLMDQGLVNRI